MCSILTVLFLSNTCWCLQCTLENPPLPPLPLQQHILPCHGPDSIFSPWLLAKCEVLQHWILYVYPTLLAIYLHADSEKNWPWDRMRTQYLHGVSGSPVPRSTQPRWRCSRGTPSSRCSGTPASRCAHPWRWTGRSSCSATRRPGLWRTK